MLHIFRARLGSAAGGKPQHRRSVCRGAGAQATLLSIAVLALSVFRSADAAAEPINKCVAAGKVSYTDTACPHGAMASTIGAPPPVSDEAYWSAITNGYVAQQRIDALHATEMHRVAQRDYAEARARDAAVARAEDRRREERRRADLIALADRLRDNELATRPYRASYNNPRAGRP